MGDGAVRFVSENIDHSGTNYLANNSNLGGPFGTYQRLAAINGGQIISDFQSPTAKVTAVTSKWISMLD